MIPAIDGTCQGMAAMRPMGGQRPSPEEMFAKVDTDGSGALDGTELQAMLDRMSERMGAETPADGDLMARLDGDGDGQVSFEEFEAGRPQGPPPGGPPPAEETSLQADLQQNLLDLFTADEEDAELYAGVLA